MLSPAHDEKGGQETVTQPAGIVDRRAVHDHGRALVVIRIAR
jgi:hypothetical protein